MSKFELIQLKELEKILDNSTKLSMPLFVLFKWDKCGVCIVNVPMIEELLCSLEFDQKTQNYWVDIDAENIWEENNNNSRWSISLAPTYHLYNTNKKLVFNHKNFLAPEVLKNVLKEIT